MKNFSVGDKIRLTNSDPKVRNTPGVVTNVDNDNIEVVLELWSRWGTFSRYFPLWFKKKEIEKI